MDTGQNDNAEQPSAKNGATVSFHNIFLQIPDRGSSWRRKIMKDVLVDLNGIMKPGLNAIMGPTGSGKTSMLDVLSGRKAPSGLSGEVLIDGAPQPPNFKCLSGYVVQDDVLMGALTVRENLTFAGILRLDSGVSWQDMDDKVDLLMDELGLSLVADSKVGTELIPGLSDGDRKRTSIAKELIPDPSVLFLDDPTSGLDVGAAYSLLLLLKKMADGGRTIVLSVHQPQFSVYRLFDRLTLLVKGKQVYHGPAPEALTYFSDIGYTCESHNNPADFFLDVIHGDLITAALSKPQYLERDRQALLSPELIEEKLLQEFHKSELHRRTRGELERISSGVQSPSAPSRTTTYSCSFFLQFLWVCVRSMHGLVLEPRTSVLQLKVPYFIHKTLLSLFMAVVAGALLSVQQLDVVGIQNRFGAVFLAVMFHCFSSVASVELFVAERKTFIHEHISGYYSVSAYFLGRVAADAMAQTTPIIAFMVFRPIIQMDGPGDALVTWFFTLLFVSYTSSALALAVSIDHSVTGVANVHVVLVSAVMMLFAGFLVNLASIPEWLMWLKYISVPYYASNALQINAFVGRNFKIKGDGVELSVSGERILEDRGVDFSTWGFWQNYAALTLLTIVFLFVAFIKLRLVKKFT